MTDGKVILDRILRRQISEGSGYLSGHLPVSLFPRRKAEQSAYPLDMGIYRDYQL
jgi:hypothetical protein